MREILCLVSNQELVQVNHISIHNVLAAQDWTPRSIVREWFITGEANFLPQGLCYVLTVCSRMSPTVVVLKATLLHSCIVFS